MHTERTPGSAGSSENTISPSHGTSQSGHPVGDVPTLQLLESSHARYVSEKGASNDDEAGLP